MSRCLKCNYELTFLEKRHKYKCAKCSSLFTEEEIKLIEFKKYNITERAKEKKATKKETRKELNKKYVKTNPDYHKKYHLKNKEIRNQRSKAYYYKHKEELLVKRREKYKNGEQNESRKNRRKSNMETTRLNGRIEYWKRKQKILAESRFDELFLHKVHNKPKEILPTLILT